MITYEKKATAFNNLYKQKLNELRKLPENLLEVPKITEEDDEIISVKIDSTHRIND